MKENRVTPFSKKAKSYILSLVLLLLFYVLLLLQSAVAFAHPHVFVDAKLNVVINDEVEVVKMEQVWIFDELFTSGVILDFDTNGDHKLDAIELENIGKIIKTSMKEYAYFQSIIKNGQSIAINPPEVMHTKIENKHFVLSFSITPKQKIKFEKGNIYRFSLFDPTFYVAVDFTSEKNFTFSHLPKSCKNIFVRPNVDAILAKSADKLSEEFYADPALSLDFAMQLASYMEVKCL